MENLYLVHHGILGQKWGVRRFQNPDGSVTPAGAKRYYADPAGKKQHWESQKQKLAAAKAEYSKATAGGMIYNANATKKLLAQQRETEYAKQDYKNEKIKEKLNTETKISKHRQNLIDKYKQKGMTQEEAEVAAYKRDRTEKILAATAAVAVVAIASYAGYKYYQNNVDKMINAGTTLARVDQDPTIHDAFYAVRGNNKLDRAKYAGYYAKQMKQRYGDRWQGKSLDIGVKDGIKLASPNSARKILAKSLGESAAYRKQLENELKEWRDSGATGKQYQVLDKAVKALKAGKYNDKSVYEAANLKLADWRSSTTKKFYDDLRKAGYGAIKDVNDSKLSGFHTKDPLIVFDAAKVGVDKINPLTNEQIQRDFVKANGDIMNAALRESVKVPAILTAMGIGGANAIKSYATSARRDKIVAEYRKEHPDTDLSYEEIVRNYERSK